MHRIKFERISGDPQVYVALQTHDGKSAAAVVSQTGGVDHWNFRVSGDVTHPGLSLWVTGSRLAMNLAAGALCDALGVGSETPEVYLGDEQIGGPRPTAVVSTPVPPEWSHLGTVRDWGGGTVVIYVDRDLGNYPPVGTDVWVETSKIAGDHGDPDDVPADRASIRRALGMDEPDDEELPHWPGDGPDSWRDAVTGAPLDDAQVEFCRIQESAVAEMYPVPAEVQAARERLPQPADPSLDLLVDETVYPWKQREHQDRADWRVRLAEMWKAWRL